MKRAVLAVALVAASSGVASAGGYIGLGIGTAPALDDDSDAAELSDNGRSARLIGGMRWGRFSVEGGIGGFDARINADTIRMYQLSLSGKFNLPIGDGFEPFARAGIQRTSFNHDNPDISGSGTGLVLGVGMEYQLPLAVTKASLWIDYQYARNGIDSGLPDYSMSARQWTLGFTIGF